MRQDQATALAARLAQDRATDSTTEGCPYVATEQDGSWLVHPADESPDDAWETPIWAEAASNGVTWVVCSRDGDGGVRVFLDPAGLVFVEVD